MSTKLLELLLDLIPLCYGSYLYIRIFQITNSSTEKELEEMDKKLSRMRKSAAIFVIVGAYFMYQFYKRYYL